MVAMKEIEKKLRAAREEVKRTNAERNLLSSLSKVKFTWSSSLTPEEETAVRIVVEKYLGQEQVQAVLSACSFFRTGVMRLPHDNLARFQQRPKGRRGRPKGSKDHDAKILIRSLAAVWKKAGETLPRQVESRFGDFVKDIAKALQVKENGKGESATWAGQVNDILRHKQPGNFLSDLLETLPIQHFLEVIHQTTDAECRRIEFESRVKKLPGSEEFDVITTLKTKEKQEDSTR